MSDAELRAKYDSLAAPVLGAARAADLAAAVADIESCPDIRSLAVLFEPAAECAAANARARTD